MDIHYELKGMSFVWDARKAASNAIKHDGVTFQQAAEVFFDPFFALVDAGSKNEHRDAIMGSDTSGRLLFVVHLELDGDTVRIISARKATNEERRQHEHS